MQFLRTALRSSSSMPLPSSSTSDVVTSRFSESSSCDSFEDIAMNPSGKTLRRRVCVVGPHAVGKTSLVRSLATASDASQPTTFGVELSKWTFQLEEHGPTTLHELSIWDFVGGDEQTARLAGALTTDRILALVCVDAPALLQAAAVVLDDVEDTATKYDPLVEFVDANVLPWVRALISGTQREIAFVLTKMDLVPSDDHHATKLNDVKKKVTDHITASLFQKTSKDQEGITIRWLTVSCENEDAKSDLRTQMEMLVVASGRSFVMPELYQRVRDTIQQIRTDAAKARRYDRAPRNIMKVDVLLRAVLGKLPSMSKEDVRVVLQTLHDLGDILWFASSAKPLSDFVVLDPMLVVDLMRVVVEAHRDDRNDEVMPHASLMGLSLWNTIDDAVTTAIKQLLVNGRLAYTSRGEVEWDSDLIVPAYWCHNSSWNTTLEADTLAIVPREIDGKATKRVQWQYHFLGPLPRDFFEKVLVESYSPLWHRTITKNSITFETDEDFACRLVVDETVKNQCVVHLSAVAYAKEAPSWWVFQYAAQAIEHVLDAEHEDVMVSRCALNDNNEPHRLETLVAYWGDTSPSYRSIISWLPPDLTWYEAIIAKRGEETD